jgi:predicted transcriptional regulator
MIQKLDYDHYCLPIYEIEDCEYAIAKNEEETHKAAKEYIRDTLWSFNTEFILRYNSKVNVTDTVIEAFKKMQQELCEDCNEIVLAIIDDLDEFVKDAIDCDGLGHFLSSYDGNIQYLTELIMDKEDYDRLIAELGISSVDSIEVMLFRIN